MPSFKSHLIAFVLKHTRKKSFASAQGMHERLRASRLIEDHTPPEGLDKRLDISLRDLEGMPVYEVAPKGGATDERRIIYMHGGAYLFEITPYHWNLIAAMAKRLGVRITVPIYPLAPAATSPQIIGAGMATYRDVLGGVRPEDIVFMGDSAGGNMATVLCMMAADEGLPQPSAMVLISPALDLSMSNPRMQEVEKIDPWLGLPGGLEATRLYAPGMDFTDWRVSPIYGDLSVLPRTLILTGTHDILNPDTHIFAEKARQRGVDVELVEEKGMFHVWPLLDMPEARRARDRMVAFLQRDATVGATASAIAAN